jgi:hypothetical protein
LNKRILDADVQEYINLHVDGNVHRIALSKSPFEGVTAAELAGQIAAKKKCQKKLPLWYVHEGIYYPPLLSVEQCSSEATARYKAILALEGTLIDLTGGFGVDSFYFSKTTTEVTHCELNAELSAIAAHNAAALGAKRMVFVTGDGLAYLRNSEKHFGTVYLDPARRGTSGKVFMLADCTPNVVELQDFLLTKADRVLIKTAPLLDISVGLRSLKNVSEIHILSVRNECRELLWVIGKQPAEKIKITAVTLNATDKHFSFIKGEEELQAPVAAALEKYLYEPDAALMKSGAFNLIAVYYRLKKLDDQTQLYTSDTIHTAFPGRIFEIKEILSGADLKKHKDLSGNVIVRNFRETPEVLIRKHRIKPDERTFLIFTQSKTERYILIKAEIIQYY